MLEDILCLKLVKKKGEGKNLVCRCEQELCKRDAQQLSGSITKIEVGGSKSLEETGNVKT
jgi:hypothetical protein